MRWAASGAGDELLDAVVAYVRIEVFFANHNLRHGLRALDSAAGLVRPGTSAQAAAAYGSLHMRAAVVAAAAVTPPPVTIWARRTTPPDVSRKAFTTAPRSARPRCASTRSPWQWRGETRELPG